MHLSNVDLNLLRVFDALMEERSVTRAGARLGLSQSAVSHALGRLRHMMGDELFVRTAAGMAATPRAREIGPGVHAALFNLHAALQPSSFDPATTDRSIAFVAGSYACVRLLPPLVERLAAAAPGLQVVVHEPAPNSLEQLDTRRADFLIGAVAAIPPRLAREVLVRETLSWVARAGHPLGGRQVSIDQLAGVDHVAIARERQADAQGLAVRSSWEDATALNLELEALGLRRRVLVTVPDVYSSLAVLQRSDMVSLIPTRAAAAWCEAGLLSIIETPYASPTFELSLVYSRDRLAEPAIDWVRRQIIAAGDESVPGGTPA